MSSFNERFFCSALGFGVTLVLSVCVFGALADALTSAILNFLASNARRRLISLSSVVVMSGGAVSLASVGLGGANFSAIGCMVSNFRKMSSLTVGLFDRIVVLVSANAAADGLSIIGFVFFIAALVGAFLFFLAAVFCVPLASFFVICFFLAVDLIKLFLPI